MPSYYVGIQIEQAKHHHVTICFLKNATLDTIELVKACIAKHIGAEPFAGVPIILGDADLFGHTKNIRVRLCSFDESTAPGKVVQALASELYDTFASKDYPQNFHISAIGTADDEVIFQSGSVTGCRIYIKGVGHGGGGGGGGGKNLFSNPSDIQ